MPVQEKRLLARRPKSGVCYRDLLKTPTNSKSQGQLHVPKPPKIITTPPPPEIITTPPTPTPKNFFQEYDSAGETLAALDSATIPRQKTCMKSTTTSSNLLTVRSDMFKSYSDENIRDTYKGRTTLSTLLHCNDSNKEVLKSNLPNYTSFTGRRRHSIACIEEEVPQQTSLLTKRAQSSHERLFKYSISSSNSEQELRDKTLVPILKGARRRSLGEIYRFDNTSLTNRNNHHVRFTDEVNEIIDIKHNPEV